MIALDSSFLISFFNERDVQHVRARTLMDRFLAGEWGKGLLLEYIVLEVATVLMVRRDIAVAARVTNLLLDAEELDFVPCSDLFLETLEIFTTQKGTRLSFADAALVYVARQRANGWVLSFDEEIRRVPGIRSPELSNGRSCNSGPREALKPRH